MSHVTSQPLATVIRRYRLAAGLSQEDLAERSELSARTISDLERGLRQTPQFETVRMIADGLGLTDAERASLIAAARPELSSNSGAPATDQITYTGRAVGTHPRAQGTLIGRERAIADLVSMLSDETTRLITLTGPGGVGKTRLALAVASQLAPPFNGAVTFVPLAHIRDPSLVIPTIARTLGMNESGEQPLVDRICAVLSNRETFLVLDNMEQITEAAPDVAALIAGAPDLSVLVTSRGALRLSGEHQYPVRVLSLPDAASGQTLESMAESEAVALFIDRARMTQPSFLLTPANAPAIVEICRRLDGLPLAIELAAARIPLLPPAALLARMERRLPLLTGGHRDLPDRLQTMRAAIAWSYDLLSTEEQTGFRRLAVFMGGFTLEAAEAVMAAGDEERAVLDSSGDPLDRIAALVERGLIWQSEQPDGDARFGMLETIREFGLEQIAAFDEEENLRRAHAAWFLALAQDFEANGYVASASSLDRIERELPNVRLALAWFEQTGDSAMGLALAQSLFLLWHQRSHRAEGRGWLERTLARDPGTRSPVRAAALLQLGLVIHNDANPERGMSLVMEGLELAQELNDRHSAMYGTFLLAQFAVDAGEDEQGWRLLEKVESLGKHADDPVDDFQGFVLQNRGILARRLGDLQLATTCFIDSCAHSTRTGDDYQRAIAREFLGLIQCDAGEYSQAAVTYLESLDDWRTAGTRESLIDWLAMVATLAEAVGEPARARRWFGAVEAQVEILGFNFPLPERLEFARAAERVRSGPSDPHWSSGRSLSLERATEEAADWLRGIAMPADPATPPLGTG
jgi:predicted ATPase/transcriptional regulator with XRE-family HTH domain